MRIALIGAGGQLGTDLRASLDGDVVSLGHEEIEITDASSVERALSKIGPDRVINAAAYNLVDQAEQEPEVAYAVNACGPRHLARYCAARDVVLLHVSTDYVFGLDGGRSVPYRESEAPGPLGAYAISKLAGEFFVRSQCPRHFVVRTCGLYGHAGARGRGNFVETMLRLSAERGELTVVDDQHCTPTATADLARALAALIKTDAYGLYHATNSGSTTWCGLAREIVRWTNRDVTVRPITSAEFGAPSRRPGYSVLDNSKLTATIGFELPPWEDALTRYLERRS
jgi:dTDP-4-dehydrorhamnose reductase